VSFGESDAGAFLLALLLLLGAAHLVGGAFARVGQPRVIGEIVGGLLLGPTVAAAIFPSVQEAVFPSDGPPEAALAACSQLGLVLLMFVAGLQVRTSLSGPERRVALVVAATGSAIPFAIGLAVVALVDLSTFTGPASDYTAFALVLAAALAVTSIPVISRIMLDLGIMRTAFARVVLGAAVVEDVLMYAALAVAVGLVQGSAGEPFGLTAELGIEPGSRGVAGGPAVGAAGALVGLPAALGTYGVARPGAAYHAVSTAAFLALGLLLRSPALRATRIGAIVRAARRSTTGQLLFLLSVAAAGIGLGVVAVFGGLVAGIALAPDPEEGDDVSPAPVITDFAAALFIPLYFALVGFRLDLARDSHLALIAALLAVGWVVKSLSVLLGARLAGQPPARARHLAVAMNARGGPGIVLATVAIDAGIIDEQMFVALVLLAITTSLFAGWWLRRAVDEDPSFGEEISRTAIPAAAAAAAGRAREDAAGPAGRPGSLRRFPSRASPRG
jgi:Kef-type K+ transport system membrane component KefB